MEWLNYHHLRYFHIVAKEGSLTAAARHLRVSAPAISAQLRELEAALGERLFRREGRAKRLTDAGQLVFSYTEEIFALGGELVTAVKQRPGTKALRLHLGVVDSFPKFLTHEILRPAFTLPQEVHITCHEGKLEEMVGRLTAHRLDIVLTDEPAFSTVHPQTFSHLLGESGTTFCAHGALAARLRRGFPRTLHDAPALLPAGRTSLRRSLETWFSAHHIQPRVIVECEDLALMKVLAADGRGFLALPTVAADEAIRHYGFTAVGEAPRCTVRFHALTAARRIAHPVVAALTAAARRDLFH